MKGEAAQTACLVLPRRCRRRLVVRTARREGGRRLRRGRGPPARGRAPACRAAARARPWRPPRRPAPGRLSLTPSSRRSTRAWPPAAPTRLARRRRRPRCRCPAERARARAAAQSLLRQRSSTQVRSPSCRWSRSRGHLRARSQGQLRPKGGQRERERGTHTTLRCWLVVLGRGCTSP